MSGVALSGPTNVLSRRLETANDALDRLCASIRRLGLADGDTAS